MGIVRQKNMAPGIVVCALILLPCSLILVWRSLYKVDWAAFDTPTKIVYSASREKDLTGLLVYGWGGIKNPSQSGFFRKEPYVYFESREQIRNAPFSRDQRGKLAREISHVITSSSEVPPCSQLVQELADARLYRCTSDEIMLLWGS